jgi:hypothetical protein
VTISWLATEMRCYCSQVHMAWNHALVAIHSHLYQMNGATTSLTHNQKDVAVCSTATKLKHGPIVAPPPVWTLLRLVVLVILFNQIHHIIFSLLLLWLCIPF